MARSGRPHPATGVAVLTAAAALALGGNVGGLLAGDAGPDGGALVAGVVAAVGVVLVWLVAGTPYAFAVGQVGLVVGLDGGLTATPLTQTLLVAMLVVDLIVGRPLADLLATYVVSGTTVLGLLAIVHYGTGVLRTGGMVLLVTGLVVYSIHRYERLALDLVGEAS